MDSETDNKHCVSSGVYGRYLVTQYQEVKDQPFRDDVELYNMLSIIGDLTGKTVIDVACGYGWLTRNIKHKLHPSYAMGADLSEHMIQTAKGKDIDSIDYEVEDIREATTPHTEGFDTVVANWLLTNARDREDLAAMCVGLAGKAKPGAKLVTLLIQPEMYEYKGDMELLRKYGFDCSPPTSIYEGVTMINRLYKRNGEFGMLIESYYFPREAYREELEKAGFEDVEFINHKDLVLDPSAAERMGFYEDFFNLPLLMIITAHRQVRPGDR